MNSSVFHQNFRNFSPVQCYDLKGIRNLNVRTLIRLFFMNLFDDKAFRRNVFAKHQNKIIVNDKTKINPGYRDLVTVHYNVIVEKFG